MAAQTDRGVPLSTLCPKFLHTNSTSHTWPFSAIAELIDNAYDPDVRAKQFWIDKTVIDGQECLTFMDNGNGLNLETMHKMLSFGYSDKVAVNGLEPIGIYGNGFKSGAMRLGRDVIVFSKSKKASCIGMLSQSYLKEIGAEQIIVPIVSFEHTETNFSVGEEQQASLQDILRYSPFKTDAGLLTEVNAIRPPFSPGSTGTRILIWNLRRTTIGTTEFDFEKNRYDIRLPLDANEVKSYVPESENSLRAYCSILYLKPRMQVNIRGHKVKSQLISKSLAYIKKDNYKPTFLMNKRIPIIFGYNTKSKDHCGIMMYHKNRLIKAYKRVGCQLKANVQGLGVIGVIECDFLEPTHNKQSFSDTDKFRKTINNLAIKLEDYWHEIAHRRKTENPNNTIPVEDDTKRPDQDWVQCDDCLKWRKLPDGINCNKLPEKWFCYLNPDPQFRSCQAEEEPEDSDDEQTYSKTYKQHEREDKKNQERERKRLEEDQKRQEQERLAALHQQNETLRRQHENLKRQLRQTSARASVQSPSTPDTPRKRGNSETLEGDAVRAKSRTPRSTKGSQSAFRRSSVGGPFISNVRTLLTTMQRMERTPPDTLESTPKRPRLNRFQSDTTATTSTENHNSPSMSMTPPNDKDNTSDDDDVSILEVVSGPLPKTPDFDLTKVKSEQEESDSGSLIECVDDDAVDVALEKNASGSSSAVSATGGLHTSAALPPGLSSSATQTEVPKVKDEEEEEKKRKQIKIECQTEEGKRTVKSMPNGLAQSSDVATHVCSVEQRDVNLEGTGDTHTGGQQTLVIGVAHEEAAGPSCTDAQNHFTLHLPNMSEAQEQQDQLIDLMQSTAQERDLLKDEVAQLTSQLHDMQTRLEELSHTDVKECRHQASQTEEAEEDQNYKSLFEKAKQKVDELIKDKEALLNAAETKPSAAVGHEKEIKQEIDEIALQVDRLVRELDQRNQERDELRSQLDCMEAEKANLSSQCEELKLSLQQQRSHAEGGCSTSHTERNSTTQAGPQEARGTEASGIASSSDTSRSLMELRQNVGHLLSYFLPALDLAQVNYECDVIDEILVQVLSDEESIVSFGLRNEVKKD